jgi:hypothetical protein
VPSPGITKAEQLKHLKLQKIFTTMLGWEKQQKLGGRAEQPDGCQWLETPHRMHANEPPLLAVRLQEMYGQRNADHLRRQGAASPHLFSGLSPHPGHRRPGRLLAGQLQRCEKGAEGPLSQAFLAG